MTQTRLVSLDDAADARRDQQMSLPCRLGRWELLGLVAEGSWARVYRARPADGAADRPAAYAVKVLRPEWQDDLHAADWLLREAVAGRSVTHVHLVAILAASVSRAPRYLVMPWLEGSTLRARMLADEPLDVPWVLWVARQTAEALGALHAAGWRHGDVKPSNVFVSTEGHVTLLDLGLARRSDEDASAVDRWVAGTCSYIAPELITSSLRGDIRSDIYSLGVVLFELFAGRLPFAEQSLAELASAYQCVLPPELARLAPHVPPEIAQLVRQMIARDPLRRPQTPRELIDRLVALEIATFSERAVP